MLDRGHEQLADLQREPLSHDPRAARAGARRNCRCSGAASRIGAIGSIRYVPWWVVVAAALAVVAMTFAVYYSWLANQADPLHARLAQIGIEDFAVPPPPAPPVQGPTLKQLLAPEEAAGALSGDRGRRANDRDDSRRPICSASGQRRR